jgi:4-amino-4-deoxy-L-arabinose transferase-like glycosyltransferase
MSRDTQNLPNALSKEEAKPTARYVYKYIVGGVVILYLALSLGSALTKRPWSDEAWFASPSLNLITDGSFGTDILETDGLSFRGMKERTYWIMPLYPLVQSGWYKAVGFGVVQMRSSAALWGLLALFACYVLVMELIADLRVALLTIVLLAFDYVFIMGASNGRMDMMCAALGLTALAAYVRLRERHLTRALAVSHTLVMLSGMTHFLGVLSLAGLLFLIVRYDLQRLQWRHAVVAVTPYLVGATFWGLYIMQDPTSFVAQFTANATTGNRMSSFTNPLASLQLEIYERYLRAYGWGAHDAGRSVMVVRFKIVTLLAYLASLLGVLLTPPLRNRSSIRTLLVLTAIYFTVLLVLDGQKLTLYLVHIVPLYTVLLAVWVVWCWTTRTFPRALIVLAVCGLTALTLGGVTLRIKADDYHRSFLPAARYLKSQSEAGATIMGSAELGFVLGFKSNLIDDVRLGYLSGKRPDYIVVDETYQRSFDSYRSNESALYGHISVTLGGESSIIYNENSYRIYSHR